VLVAALMLQAIDKALVVVLVSIKPAGSVVVGPVYLYGA